MFYAALDVSLPSVAICIIDETGKVRLERSLPSDVPDVPTEKSTAAVLLSTHDCNFRDEKSSNKLRMIRVDLD
ncbi:hypothetical protein [Rhizobium ruizarguesonis]|uniref:hypothetical protein n=1 Tax=Rhizobium ruizarguesonis TaxID=2081791 RepID=UPI0018D537D7|nr:hypothetical protein [Rhizobium ruizarguesonis]